MREHGAGAGPALARERPAAGRESREAGDAEGYDNPHAHPGHVNDQQLLPEGLAGERFYDPDEAEAAAARAARGVSGVRGRG